jgi:hypothetical protein
LLTCIAARYIALHRLDLPTLRQHLWVEPHRLFQPTDRTLSQLR